MVQKEEEDLNEAIEEVYRLRKYHESRNRPLKIKFSMQMTTEEVLGKNWKLAQKEEYKKNFIRKDKNEEEKAKMSAIVKEAKAKNELRTEEEKREVLLEGERRETEERVHKCGRSNRNRVTYVE